MSDDMVERVARGLPDEIQIDGDGYPDDVTLDQIRAASAIEDGAAWMRETFPRLAAELPYGSVNVTDVTDFLGKPIKRIEFHTGGWSGCEDFINAVLGNLMLHMMFYAEWRRGGLHVFEVPFE